MNSQRHSPREFLKDKYNSLLIITRRNNFCEDNFYSFYVLQRINEKILYLSMKMLSSYIIKQHLKNINANIFSNLACFSFSRHFVISITENESKGSKSVISRGHGCYGNTGKVFANFKALAILVLFLKIPKI